MKPETIPSKKPGAYDALTGGGKKNQPARRRSYESRIAGTVAKGLKRRSMEATMPRQARANQKFDAQSLKLTMKELQVAMQSLVDRNAEEGDRVTALRTACASLKFVVTRHSEITQAATEAERAKAKERLTQSLRGTLLRELMPTLTAEELLAVTAFPGLEDHDIELNELIDQIRFSAKGESLRRAMHGNQRMLKAEDKGARGIKGSAVPAEQCAHIHALASDLIKSAKAFSQTKSVIAGIRFTPLALEEIRSRYAWSTVKEASASDKTATSEPGWMKPGNAALTGVMKEETGIESESDADSDSDSDSEFKASHSNVPDTAHRGTPEQDAIALVRREHAAVRRMAPDDVRALKDAVELLKSTDRVGYPTLAYLNHLSKEIEKAQAPAALKAARTAKIFASAQSAGPVAENLARGPAPKPTEYIDTPRLSRPVHKAKTDGEALMSVSNGRDLRDIEQTLDIIANVLWQAQGSHDLLAMKKLGESALNAAKRREADFELEDEASYLITVWNKDSVGRKDSTQCLLDLEQAQRAVARAEELIKDIDAALAKA